MSKFIDGDLVQICMTSNTAFGFIRKKARITYVPQATGDCWRFLVLGTTNHESFELLINPSCSEFAGLVIIQDGEGQ